jgi:hypothetical protein
MVHRAIVFLAALSGGVVAFLARGSELAELDAHLDDVRRGTHADPGVVVNVRGRHRVGKSRLVAEFVRRCESPYAFVEADDDAATLEELLARIDELPSDTASVVIVDDASSLLRTTSGVESLRRVWDRDLARRRLLLLLVSDPEPADAPAAPTRAWRGRSATLQVEPLNPAEIADLTGQDAFGAIDSYLITGGLPLAVEEWDRGMPRDAYLRASFERSTSALIVTGQRLLDGSLPDTSYARSVLAAIGGRGEQTFTSIYNAVSDGSMSRNSLTASLEALFEAGLIAADEPLSTRPAPKDRRWRVVDPALSFWLAFVEPALGAVDRGQPEEAMRLVDEGFAAWRDRTVAAVVHDALSRLLPDSGWPEVRRVGGWWSRSKSGELALVGATDAPTSRISLVGTIAWRRIDPLSRGEIDRLVTDAPKVPGVDAGTALVAVCPAGCTADDRIVGSWSAEDLMAAWAR